MLLDFDDKYWSQNLSIPSILTLGSAITVFVLAYYVPYATPSSSISTFTEQPQVEYTGKWMYQLQGSNATDTQVYRYSTNAALLSPSDEVLAAQLTMDKLQFTLTIPIRPSLFTSSHLTLALELNYKLQQVVPLQMKSLAVFDVVLIQNAAVCKVNSIVEWQQSKPIPPPYTQLDQVYDPEVASLRLVYDTSVIDGLTSADLGQYFDRAEKTMAKYQVQQVLDKTATQIQVSGSIQVPVHSIQYRQGIAERMKLAFIPYFVYLVTFGSIAYLFHRCVTLQLPGVFVQNPQGRLQYKF